jgi:hypothetical protein
MSSNNFTSSSSFSFSSTSSSTINGQNQTTGHRSVHQTTSDPINGTTTHSSTQNIGQPAVQETRHYDPQGRELLKGSGGADGSRRIEDVSESQTEKDTQAERDALYEERMEDEYAKREGGA